MSEKWEDVTNAAIDAMRDYVVADQTATRKSESETAVLYHLTTTETAIAISNPPNVLRAFEISTMNDATEVIYGRNLIRQGLEQKVQRTLYEERLKRYLANPQALPGFHLRLRHFVASFCSRPERASTWLNYGRNGTGVAMGFKRGSLRAFTDENLNEENPYLVEIEYRPEKQLSRLQGMVDVGASILEKYDVSGQPTYANVVAHIAQVWLSAIAVRMKHPSFEQEDEWRLIEFESWLNDEPSTGDEGVLAKKQIFGSLGQIRPYVEFSLPANPASDYVLGYSSQVDQFHFREALHASFKTLPISRSAIPVRPV